MSSVPKTTSAKVQGINVRRLSPVMGGEVRGTNVRDLIRRKDAVSILQAVWEHSVVVFRDQQLTGADFVALGRLLGELELHVLDQYRLAEHPEIYVISNIIKDGKPIGNPKEGFGWHTDQSYLRHPTAYTLLYGLEVPAEGADTLFCNTYAALEAMDDATRKKVASLRGIHSYTYMRYGASEYAQRNTVDGPLRQDQLARVPDVIHPVARTHPHTGRKSLYLGGDCLAGFEGMTDEGSKALKAELFAFALERRFQYAHKWQPRDVVIWDNRGTMHTATEYDRQRYRRHLWRLSVQGEIPN